MGLVPEALGIDFVDVLRTGWPGCEPSGFRNDLQTFDGSPIPRSSRQLRNDRLTREARLLDRLG